MPSTDPKVTIRNLLVANWNSANTSSITPKIHMGWYNTAWDTTPQVTITNATYSIFSGGSTGVTAIGAGGQNVRLIFVDVSIGCWAHHEMVDGGSPISVNPRQLTYEMANEVKRIMEANMFTDSELDWLTWDGMNEDVDTRIKPVVFSYMNNVRLAYREAF